jgi:hypothetical protein
MHRNHWFGVGIVLALLVTAAPEVEAKGSVRVTFTTTPIPGQYSPNNVVAAWIQNSAGTHVKTIGTWTAVRTASLTQYIGKAGSNDANNLAADAVSGASRSNHMGTLTAAWNLVDKAGAAMPDGTYTIRLELAESNGGTGNHEGTFTFVKGPSPQMQTGLSNGGFTNVTIDFDPNRVTCGDGIVDAPETCDFTVSGSCVVNQTGCASNKCAPEVFQGNPMQCTATCVAQAPITTCVAGDGCCPAGCDPSTDSDCGKPGTDNGDGSMNPGGGTNDSDVAGGCSAGAEGGLAIFALFGLLLKGRPNRRRVVRHDAVRAKRE